MPIIEGQTIDAQNDLRRGYGFGGKVWKRREFWNAFTPDVDRAESMPFVSGGHASDFDEDNAEGMDALCVRPWGAQNARAALWVFALRGDLPYHRNRGRWLSECFSPPRNLL